MENQTEQESNQNFVSGLENMAFGKSLRAKCSRTTQGEWEVHRDRSRSIDLILSQKVNRIPELIPIRHKRMTESSFAFYRGAAIVMADDLSNMLRTSIVVQACGDAHISNLGMFRSVA